MILVISLLLNCIVYGQAEIISDFQEADSELTNRKTSLHSLYGSAGFASNLVYMGTSISQDKPVFSGSLIYGFRDKLYFSASTFHLSAFDPFLAFHTFSLNYSQAINSWLDISLGISRYQVAASLTDTLFNSFNYGSAAIGFDWKILYSNISVAGIFSDVSNAYLQLRNSRYFQTQQLNNSKVYLSFDPYVNILFGTLTRTESSEGTTIGISQPFSSKGSGRNSSQISSSFFGLMEIDLGVPLAFNAGKITIEAEPGYVFPFYSDTVIFNPKGFVFLLNCYVRIL